MKTRRKVAHFQETRPDGSIIVKPSYVIEILVDGHWPMLGDENGILKFATAEARDAKLAELQPALDCAVVKGCPA